MEICIKINNVRVKSCSSTGSFVSFTCKSRIDQGPYIVECRGRVEISAESNHKTELVSFHDH
jgi:hypothetical protein